MRLDKFLSNQTTLSRKEATLAIRKSRVKVDDKVIIDPAFHIDEMSNAISLDGMAVGYKKYVYIMLNKPAGYVSSTDDPGAPTVIELLDDSLKSRNLFPCGRLDRYTTGLMILTDDGVCAHRNLSPKHHAEKKYVFTTRDKIERVNELEEGVHIAGGYLTKPCKVELIDEHSAYITLTEGKYHQIKQMLHAVGNEVTTLKRVSFAGIQLDSDLSEGEYRELTNQEQALFTRD